MKVVILAGGFGSRMYEETLIKPKPMIDIGEKPIIWHLMKLYSWYGFNEFILCLGYKKEYFFEYFDNKIDYKSFEPKIFEGQLLKTYYSEEERWKVTLVDTGTNTMSAGRLKRIKNLIKNETFLLTYGDTLSDINLGKLLKFHIKNEVLATLTTVQPISNYGIITFQDDQKLVKNFEEKPIEKNKWINGGFYVFESEIFDLIIDDSSVLELEILNKIISKNMLSAYKHIGFWKSIETYKDKLQMNDLWNSNKSKWNVWDQKLRKVL